MAPWTAPSSFPGDSVQSVATHCSAQVLHCPQGFPKPAQTLRGVPHHIPPAAPLEGHPFPADGRTILLFRPPRVHLSFPGALAGRARSGHWTCGGQGCAVPHGTARSPVVTAVQSRNAVSEGFIPHTPHRVPRGTTAPFSLGGGSGQCSDSLSLHLAIRRPPALAHLPAHSRDFTCSGT